MHTHTHTHTHTYIYIYQEVRKGVHNVTITGCSFCHKSLHPPMYMAIMIGIG